MFFLVPKPEITPILEQDGSVPFINPNSFDVSFLIEVDPAVDVSLDVSAVWSGNPALSDSPRVMPQPSSTQEPYITTLAFSSIKPSDLGVYILTVQLNANSLEGVVSSDPVELEVTLSFGKVYINLTKTILSFISDIYFTRSPCSSWYYYNRYCQNPWL